MKELASGKKGLTDDGWGEFPEGRPKNLFLKKDQESTKWRLKGSGQRAWGQQSTPGKGIPRANARSIVEPGYWMGAMRSGWRVLGRSYRVFEQDHAGSWLRVEYMTRRDVRHCTEEDPNQVGNTIWDP